MKLTKPESIPQLVDRMVGMGMQYDETPFGDICVGSGGLVNNTEYQRAMATARTNWKEFLAELRSRVAADAKRLHVWVVNLVNFMVEQGMTYEIDPERGLVLEHPSDKGPIYARSLKMAKDRWPLFTEEIVRRLSDVAKRYRGPELPLKCDISKLVDFLVGQGMTIKSKGVFVDIEDPEGAMDDPIYSRAACVGWQNSCEFVAECKKRLAVKS